jgi:enoyl-CoA hydratase
MIFLLFSLPKEKSNPQAMAYENIIVTREKRPGVTLIELNRPKALNALNTPLMTELGQVLKELEGEDDCKCVVLAGNERAFAAGADIKEMADASTVDMHKRDQFSRWDPVKRFKKPLIAAVSGFALGGGCELSMHCDMIVASETAQFGQPEINIGVMPGAGGTQRLTRAIGKARAMEMVLAGEFIGAEEAREAGLINKVVPKEVFLDEALKLGAKVAGKPPIAAQMAKEAVQQAYETTLEEGLLFERKNFYLLFSTADQKEGMQAFIEKRNPEWKGE